MVVIFSLSTYKTDICVPKQLSVYTQECAVYKISWGGWAGGILSTLKIKQKGFCPKKGFCPSWKIYRRDSVHLVKMSGRDYIHVAKNMGGIMSTYTKMSRRDYVPEGFCPTLYFKTSIASRLAIFYRLYSKLIIKMNMSQ